MTFRMIPKKSLEILGPTSRIPIFKGRLSFNWVLPYPLPKVVSHKWMQRPSNLSRRKGNVISTRES